VTALRDLLVSAAALLPEGGQRTARHNARTAMGEDARRARERRGADVVPDGRANRFPSTGIHTPTP
jgi:hypothetical protein